MVRKIKPPIKTEAVKSGGFYRLCGGRFDHNKIWLILSKPLNQYLFILWGDQDAANNRGL